MQTFALRLKPHADLKQSLQEWVAHKDIQAGCVISAVGSLEQATLRFAGRSVPRLLKRKFEIVSLVGTLSRQGLHLHLSLADAWGQVIGGHLMEGCLIYTTAELVLAELPGYTFTREIDRHTGYLELIIRESPNQKPTLPNSQLPYSRFNCSESDRGELTD